MLKQEYFPNFSEIYFLNEVPVLVPNKRFTSDGCFFDSDIPESFFESMSIMGAVRYLSDGCGLNIASKTQINFDHE
jgi:hypothetical protein